MKTLSELALDALLENGGYTPAYPEPLALELAFTNCYRRSKHLGFAQRELACLQIQFPTILQPLQPGDLFAGRIRYPLAGFSPEPGGLGFYCREADIRVALERLDFPASRRLEIEAMLAFWRTESTQARIRAACLDWVGECLLSDRWAEESGAAFPLYRIAGTNLDYALLLRLGLPGLRRHIESRQAVLGPDSESFCAALIGAVQLVENCCRHYAAQARMLVRRLDRAQSEDCVRLGGVLERLVVQRPATLREAIQLMWLCALLSGTWNYGRMDVFLGPFLRRDLELGGSEADALALLQSLWGLMKAYDNQYNNRVIIGGVGRPETAAADRFALLALEATRIAMANQPQLSLRLHQGQDPALLDKALTMIGEGSTFPILYNDDVNVPAVRDAFGVSEAEAIGYTPFGCGEYGLGHRSVDSPNGIINLLKCLEVALHNGVDPVTSRQAGPRTGDPIEFLTFDDLWRAYVAQVEYCMAACAVQEAIEYRVAGQSAPFLLLSLLCDDCLERGRGILQGGIRYLGGTIETYGNTNVSDSLTAIERLVYREDRLSLAELVAACDADFAALEPLRQELLAAPKYGNDDFEADAMARRVHEQVCRCAQEQASRAGLRFYLVVVINNWANVILGRHTLASADGRRRGEPMANGNNPSPGMDRHGLTAFLNSLVTLPANLHAGSVQNMKFSRSLFGPYRAKTEALLGTYFGQGGTQAMITVVSRADLEAALLEPEKWGHLIVRVGGFSARFIDLPREAQMEMLARTLYE